MVKCSPVRVEDLKDQTGITGPRPLLKCFSCGEENSANRGDYFSLNPAHVFKHCRRNMWLVTRETRFVPVEVA